jgi:hypothetical protein
MLDEWADKCAAWFEEIKEDSNTPLDEHWEVTRDDKSTDNEGNDFIWLTATNPRLPYAIRVLFWRGFAVLTAYTALVTEPNVTFIKDSNMTSDQKKLKVYRDLLLLNDDWKMVKFVIAGDDKEIRLKVGLNLHSLSREEFSDALGSIIFGMEDLHKKFRLKERLDRAQMRHIWEIIQAKIKEGQTREQITEYIMDAFKTSRTLADNVVDAAFSKDKEKKPKEPDFRYIG